MCIKAIPAHLEGVPFAAIPEKCLARPFRVDIDWADDLDWMLWALKQGYSIRRTSKLAVKYANKAGIKRRYLKGYGEAYFGIALIREYFGIDRKSIFFIRSSQFYGQLTASFIKVGI